ncbi:MAG: class I SAM-dependent methyltransferase [Candidatus Omnitrophota bacterium]
MNEFYPFWPGEKVSFHPDINIYTRQRKKLNLLKKYINNKTGEVLDVGTGSGEFLELMKDNGWRVSGVEYAKTTSEYARENLHLNVKTGDLLETNFQSCYFDLVTLWDSLEHLYSPKETLIEINRILKDDGLLVISTPNIDNLAAMMFKNFWYTNVPRHLYQFSPKTIKLVLKKANFKAFRIIYTAGFCEPVGFAVTFKTLVQSKFKINSKGPAHMGSNQNPRPSLKTILLFKESLRLVLELIFLPISILSVLIKKGPNMIIFAKKC